MTNDTESAARQALLRKVYETYADVPKGAAEREARAFDFQFHMTDWMSDFVKLGWAMFQPGTPPTAEATAAVYAFLIHAVPHLNAAYETLHGEPVRHPFVPTPPAAAVPVRKAKSRRTVVAK